MTHTRPYKGWTLLVDIEPFGNRHRARVSVREPGRGRGDQQPIPVGVAPPMPDIEKAKEAGFELGQKWIDERPRE
jgi:hypothetical protein